MFIILPTTIEFERDTDVALFAALVGTLASELHRALDPEEVGDLVSDFISQRQDLLDASEFSLLAAEIRGLINLPDGRYWN